MNDEENIIPIDLKHTISVHDAVFQLLGITYGPLRDNIEEDYEPTLNEILYNIQEKADTKLANAVFALWEFEKEHSEDAPKFADEVARLNNNIRKCEESLEEAHQTYRIGREYYQQLRNEIAKATSGKDTVIVVDQEETRLAGYTQITKVSFAEWCKQVEAESDNYHGTLEVNRDEPRKLPEGTNWEDLTVKIKSRNRIAYSYEKGRFRTKELDDIGLFDNKKGIPNNQGGILIGFCAGKKYPPETSANPKHKTAMTKLRKSLCDLTGLPVDPFKKYNQTDGWQPRFKPVDGRKDSDDRARREASHESYDDSQGYDHEDDEAALYLQNHTKNSD